MIKLSVHRPTFVSCLFILLSILGGISYFSLPVELYPRVHFPTFTILSDYQKSSPQEMEQMVTKIIEDEISTMGGIKTLESYTRLGKSAVIVSFNNTSKAEDKEKDLWQKIGNIKGKLPSDLKEIRIEKGSFSSTPIAIVSLDMKGDETLLHDLANKNFKDRFLQVEGVGKVELCGTSPKEIEISFSREVLSKYGLTLQKIDQRLKAAGHNYSLGKFEGKEKSVLFRSIGEFHHLEQIKKTVLSFEGNEHPITLGEIATLRETQEETPTKTFTNGQKGAIFFIYKQEDANSLELVQNLNKTIALLNKEGQNLTFKPTFRMVIDFSAPIRDNIEDVKESLYLGILFTLLIVFLFLKNIRSTLITGISLPISLLGAFFLMNLFHFSLNMMTLLSLSLVVGLLIDDAIVVRENIFRLSEEGHTPFNAAILGTQEVFLAVVATTLTIVAVFGSVVFLQGATGVMLKEFGLTICFAMLISLLDACAMAPLLSAYFGASLLNKDKETKASLFQKSQKFFAFLSRLNIKIITEHPLKTILFSFLFFVGSLYVATTSLEKKLLPESPSDALMVNLLMPLGTSSSQMQTIYEKADRILSSHKEIEKRVALIAEQGKRNNLLFFIQLFPIDKRDHLSVYTIQKNLQEKLSALKPKFVEVFLYRLDLPVDGGERPPFLLKLKEGDFTTLRQTAETVYKELQSSPYLSNPYMDDMNGEDELQVVIDEERASQMGVVSGQLGEELSYQLGGVISASLHEKGYEHNVRLTIDEKQKDLMAQYKKIVVPNINGQLVPLSSVTSLHWSKSPQKIYRENRETTIMISSQLSPTTKDLDLALLKIKEEILQKIPSSSGIRYSFEGQNSSLSDFFESMKKAFALSLLFIFLVLASLYESFFLPIIVMTGAIMGLYFFNLPLDLFATIGLLMLMGVSLKNSILLVDAIQKEDVVTALQKRTRPIMMTTMALIAGMFPLLLSVNELHQQRLGLAVSVFFGTISSTLLTLFVIPALYQIISRPLLKEAPELSAKIF